MGSDPPPPPLIIAVLHLLHNSTVIRSTILYLQLQSCSNYSCYCSFVLPTVVVYWNVVPRTLVFIIRCNMRVLVHSSVYCTIQYTASNNEINSVWGFIKFDFFSFVFSSLLKSYEVSRLEMECKEFEPRFKSAKTRFKLSAGLNLGTFDTILSGSNHI